MRWEASRGLPVRRIPWRRQGRGLRHPAGTGRLDEAPGHRFATGRLTPRTTRRPTSWPRARRPRVTRRAPQGGGRPRRSRSRCPHSIVAASVIAYTTWRASTADTGNAPGGAGSVADAGAPTAAATAAGADERRGESDAITLELSGPGRSPSRIGVAPGRCGYTEYASGDRLEFCARPAGDWLDVSVLFTPKPDATKPPGRQAPATFRLARDTKIRIISPLVLDLEWVSPDQGLSPARGGRAH